jgi:hypothetical protein
MHLDFGIMLVVVLMFADVYWVAMAAGMQALSHVACHDIQQFEVLC